MNFYGSKPVGRSFPTTMIINKTNKIIYILLLGLYEIKRKITHLLSSKTVNR